MEAETGLAALEGPGWSFRPSGKPSSRATDARSRYN